MFIQLNLSRLSLAVSRLSPVVPATTEDIHFILNDARVKLMLSRGKSAKSLNVLQMPPCQQLLNAQQRLLAHLAVGVHHEAHGVLLAADVLHQEAPRRVVRGELPQVVARHPRPGYRATPVSTCLLTP